MYKYIVLWIKPDMLLLHKNVENKREAVKICSADLLAWRELFQFDAGEPF